MAEYYTIFDNLTFGEIKHFITKRLIQVGDIKEDEGYCGVAHVYDIEWFENSGRFDLDEAKVDLYIAPFLETNPEMKMNGPGPSDHKVVMKKLKLWDSFENFKRRVCDQRGNIRPNFRVEKETELFYGFTRKDKVWYSTSCSLNCWIKSVSNIQAPEVVRNAGIRGADNRKPDLINIMPHRFWEKLLPRLEKLTPLDGKPWTREWASAERGVRNELEVAKFKEEQVCRMRRLVFKCGEGSKLYSLYLERKKIGAGGLSAVQALADVLQEKAGMDNQPRCRSLSRLQLQLNHLTTEYMGVLAPSIANCSKLEYLNLGDNKLGNEGCKVLSRVLSSNIKVLNLWNNGIGDDGIIELINNIPSSITTLNVKSNNIQQDGCKKLLEFRESPNNHLHFLNLEHNPGMITDVNEPTSPLLTSPPPSYEPKLSNSKKRTNFFTPFRTKKSRFCYGIYEHNHQFSNMMG